MKYLLLTLALTACLDNRDPAPTNVNTPTFNPGPPGTVDPSCTNGRSELTGGTETLVLRIAVPSDADILDSTLFLSDGSVLAAKLKPGYNVLTFSSSADLTVDEVVNNGYDLHCN